MSELFGGQFGECNTHTIIIIILAILIVCCLSSVVIAPTLAWYFTKQKYDPATEDET